MEASLSFSSLHTFSLSLPPLSLSDSLSLQSVDTFSSHLFHFMVD